MKYADSRFVRDALGIHDTKINHVAEGMRRVLAEETEPTVFSIESCDVGWSAAVLWRHHDGDIVEMSSERKQMWRAVAECALWWLRARRREAQLD